MLIEDRYEAWKAEVNARFDQLKANEGYLGQIERLEEASRTASGRPLALAARQLRRRRDQLAELGAFEQRLHHLADQMIVLDLNDGVKANYAKLQPVLAQIK